MEAFFINILTGIVASFNLPSVALMVLFVGAFYVLHAAQKRPDFDLGNMFKNDSGKESAVALGILIAIILSGWVLVYDTISNQTIDSTIYSIYLGIWSGTTMGSKLLEVLKIKWSGPTPASVTTTVTEVEPAEVVTTTTITEIESTPKPSDKV